MTADGVRSGLRERKKQATKEALTLAALRLALAHGLENVRVEDIAAEAGVSARTFNNYFTSKYDALVARYTDRMRQVAETLRAAPADVPLWDAVTHAVLTALGDGDRARDQPEPEVLKGIRLLISEPALRAEALKAGLAADSELAVAIARRTGTDVDTDTYPRLMAGAVATAMQAGTDTWLRADPPVALAPVVEEALRLLAAGLPDPNG